MNEAYLQILPIEKLPQYNLDYNTEKYAPGYLIFGSNLGGTAYAFEKGTGKIVSFEFVTMLIAEQPEYLGDDFTSFLRTLSLE